jgi:hypothetical protein
VWPPRKARHPTASPQRRGQYRRYWHRHSATANTSAPASPQRHGQHQRYGVAKRYLRRYGHPYSATNIATR